MAENVIGCGRGVAILTSITEGSNNFLSPKELSVAHMQQLLESEQRSLNHFEVSIDSSRTWLSLILRMAYERYVEHVRIPAKRVQSVGRLEKRPALGRARQQERYEAIQQAQYQLRERLSGLTEAIDGAQ